MDFVDVDILGDTRVFVDPGALRLLPSAWGDHCVYLIQDFFRRVLTDIRNGNDTRARDLLLQLREPNETHLGLSREEARGRALGPTSVRKVSEALRDSEAVKSGLLEDLEDSILMVPGVAEDVVSDITTNLIRGPLIDYTQAMATIHGIPIQQGVESGPIWDAVAGTWISEFTQLPITSTGKLLLVPKVIVRQHMDYKVDEYYRYYLIPHLQDVELTANSELVQLLKNGRRRVTKKDVEAKYGSGKGTIVRETRNHPEVLDRYRQSKRRKPQPPMTHEDIATETATDGPDWADLLGDLTDCSPGTQDASRYHRAVFALLKALFYPALSHPRLEHEIHEGRKRLSHLR
ncbi:MAG TPA: hypothetical protein VGC47_04705 [Acidimicrobiia bacterium]